MKENKTQYFAMFLLLIVAVIWGSGFIASQMALDANVSPELLMMVRFSIATIIIGIAFHKKIKANKFNNIKKILPGGFFLFFAFFTQIIALQYTTPANNAFLTATNVVMVPFIWWAISKKVPKPNIFVASVLCLVGVALLSVKFNEGLNFALGDWLTILCALLFAGHIVSSGLVADKIDTPIIVFYQFATATVLSIAVFLLFTEKNISALYDINALGPLLYLGLLSTCLCYFLQIYGQKHVSASKSAIILGTEALFGSLFSVLLGYDALTWNMIAGGAVIMVALIATEYTGAKKLSSKLNSKN